MALRAGRVGVRPDQVDAQGRIIGGGGGAKNILSGPNIPISAIGSDGDIYLRYNEIYNLPDYTQLANIGVGSTAGAFIDTGILPADVTGFELKFRFTSESAKSNNNGIFGAGQSNGESEFQYFNGIFISWGNESTTVSFDTDFHVVKLENGKVYVDGVEKITAGSVFPNANVCLFAFSYDGTLGQYKGTYIEVEYLKISTSSVTKNLVPVKRNADNELGLYDIINDEFYDNDGSGSFVSGGEANETILDTYCKVNDSWQSLVGTDIDDVNK